MLAEQAERQGDLVAEVDRPGFTEELLVAGIRAGQLALPPRRLAQSVAVGAGRDRRLGGQPRRMSDGGGRRDILVLEAREERCQRVEEARRVAEGPVLLEVEPEEALGAGRSPISGRDRTRGSEGRPSSRACSRITRSPKAWKVEITVSV